MAPKLQVISIMQGEDLDAALAKIARYARHLSFYVMEQPQSLMGNFKVLKLVVRGSAGDNVYKVDGPGFIIDKLYEHFLKR